jgi:hypothetical protein
MSKIKIEFDKEWIQEIEKKQNGERRIEILSEKVNSSLVKNCTTEKNRFTTEHFKMIIECDDYENVLSNIWSYKDLFYDNFSTFGDNIFASDEVIHMVLEGKDDKLNALRGAGKIMFTKPYMYDDEVKAIRHEKIMELYDLNPQKFSYNITKLWIPGVIKQPSDIDFFINELKKDLGLSYDEAAGADNGNALSDVSQLKERLGDQENNTKLSGVVEQGGDL